MNRKNPLPSHLEPWFTVEAVTGIVRCKRCPAHFLGRETTDGYLARHASYHIMGKPAMSDPGDSSSAGGSR